MNGFKNRVATTICEMRHEFGNSDIQWFLSAFGDPRETRLKADGRGQRAEEGGSKKLNL